MTRQQTLFSEMLTRFRHERRLSQNRLAKRTGVARSYISRLEKADRRVPSYAIVEGLADGLELKASDRAQFFAAANYVPSGAQHLVIMWYQLSPGVRRMLLSLIEAFLGQKKAENAATMGASAALKAEDLIDSIGPQEASRRTL